MIMDTDIRVELPPGGRITGTLIFREMTNEEDATFAAERQRAYRKKDGAIVRLRGRYFDRLVQRAEQLRFRGRPIDTMQEDWKSHIPPSVKEMLILRLFEDAGQLSDQEEDAISSDEPSES